MLEENFILTVIWKNQEDHITFLKEQDVSRVYSKCLPSLNLSLHLIIVPSITNSKYIHIFSNTYIYTKGISAISTKNGPKWCLSKETLQFFRAMHT